MDEHRPSRVLKKKSKKDRKTHGQHQSMSVLNTRDNRFNHNMMLSKLKPPRFDASHTDSGVAYTSISNGHSNGVAHSNGVRRSSRSPQESGNGRRIDPRPELDITLKARAFSYNPKTNQYIIKIENAKILSTNTEGCPPSVIFGISPSKIHKTSQTQLLHEDDIDAILDEIERNEKRLRERLASKQLISPRHYQQHPNGHQYYLTHHEHMFAALHPHDTLLAGGAANGLFRSDGHEYSRSLSYSQRNHIQQDHLREESKQQIPTIQERANPGHRGHHHHGHDGYNGTLDSLQSIPPLPSLGSPSHLDQMDAAAARDVVPHDKRSYNKYHVHEHQTMQRKRKALIEKKKRELISEWKAMNMSHENGMQCQQGRSMRHCGCIDRIKFVLHHYANWVRIRTTKSVDHGNGDGVNVMMYYESITSFFRDLQYDAVELSNDFEHIRDFHINNNSSLLLQRDDSSHPMGDDGHSMTMDADEEMLDSVSQQNGKRRRERQANGAQHHPHNKPRHDTMEFFGVVLGKCDAKHCNILLRHCRDRDKIDNKQEAKRKKLFFISGHDADSATARAFALKEVFLETKMDIIHTALLHQQTNVMLLNKSKFITKIIDRDESGSSKKNGNDCGDSNASKGAGGDDRDRDVVGGGGGGGGRGHSGKRGPSDDDEMKMEHLPKVASPQRMVNGSATGEVAVKLNKHGARNKGKVMPFGESITYWDRSHHLYCKRKYADLREELLENALYSISPELFDQIMYFGSVFLDTEKGRRTVALRDHDWMKRSKIAMGTRITRQHLLALYCYTNLGALRSRFLKMGYRHYYNHETVSREELMVQHQEMWHWSRLLLECVHCFGSPLDGDWKYYHGVNCQLLFDRFNIMMDCPSSLTLDKDFAYTFSSGPGSGIMVELNHGTLSDLQSLGLDNSLISEFPFEEERFIFHSYVSIKDIVINGLHHDQWLKIFRFWYKLKEGFFFDHLIGEMGVTKNDQLCICAMIINMMLGRGNEDHERYDDRIPFYMQCLFNECIQNKAFVWIIDTEYVHLAPKLKSLLFYNASNLSASSQFIRFLVTEKKCNVCKCNTFEWTIADSLFDALLYGDHQWVKSSKYSIYLHLNGDYGTAHPLTFHFECQDKPKNGLFRCRVHLDHCPANIARVNLGIGVYADKVNVDNYSYAEIRCDEKLYNSSLHSLFPTKMLSKYHSLKLKLQIQLFYLHDANGKMIKFQPV